MVIRKEFGMRRCDKVSLQLKKMYLQMSVMCKNLD